MTEPQRRVRAGIRRLMGVHPIQLFLEEVARNPHMKRINLYNSIREVLTSRQPSSLKNPILNANRNIKSNTANRDYINMDDTDVRRFKHFDGLVHANDARVLLSPEQQVASLLELVQDPNVLVRQFIGLKTWI